MWSKQDNPGGGTGVEGTSWGFCLPWQESWLPLEPLAFGTLSSSLGLPSGEVTPGTVVHRMG